MKPTTFRPKLNPANEPPSSCWEPLPAKIPPDQLILNVLASGPKTLNRIASEIGLSHEATVRAISWMLRNGFISTSKTSTDRAVSKTTLLTLTEAGRERWERLGAK